MAKRKRVAASKSTDDLNAAPRTIDGVIVEYDKQTLPFNMQKYWNQRHRLFSKFDEGILMDKESWYSVTPEPLARHIAQELNQCGVQVIVDGFCGAGGNAIAFAEHASLVYAWDIDPVKIECAKNNAKLYGVADRIHFQVGNFFDLIKDVQTDCVFLSPPWGGPSYNTHSIFDLTQMQPYNAETLMRAAREVTKNVVLYVPRQSSQQQIAALETPPLAVELQYLKCNNSLKALCCYFGALASVEDIADTKDTDIADVDIE